MNSSSTNGDFSVDATISRPGAKTRNYTGNARSSNEAVKDLLKKVFDDPGSAEYIR